jgi:hypothetical protein
MTKPDLTPRMLAALGIVAKGPADYARFAQAGVYTSTIVALTKRDLLRGCDARTTRRRWKITADGRRALTEGSSS